MKNRFKKLVIGVAILLFLFYISNIIIRSFYFANKNTLVDLGGGYFKDRSCVWLNGKPIKRNLFFCAEPDSFELLQGGFFKDKDNVYTSNLVFESVISHTKVVKGVKDPRSFTVFGKDNVFYKKDKYHVYEYITYQNSDGQFPDLDVLKPVNFIDAATFQPLSEYYSKDKNNVYYNNLQYEFKIMSDTDVASFETINSNYWSTQYAKDKNHVYYDDRIIDSADVYSLLVLDNGYSKDKKCVYLYSDQLSGCGDPDSFTILYDYFSKDKNSVYKNINKVSGVKDPSSFTVYSAYYRGDKYQLYDYDEEMWKLKANNIDVATFQLLDGYEYAKDRAHVYKAGKIIDGADPHTFKIN